MKNQEGPTPAKPQDDFCDHVFLPPTCIILHIQFIHHQPCKVVLSHKHPRDCETSILSSDRCSATMLSLRGRTNNFCYLFVWSLACVPLRSLDQTQLFRKSSCPAVCLKAMAEKLGIFRHMWNTLSYSQFHQM